MKLLVCFQSLAIVSLLGTNILLSILFITSSDLITSLPYGETSHKITVKITVLYVLTPTFLDRAHAN